MGGPLVLKVRREHGDIEPRLVVELHHLQMGRVRNHLLFGENVIVRADAQERALQIHGVVGGGRHARAVVADGHGGAVVDARVRVHEHFPLLVHLVAVHAKLAVHELISCPGHILRNHFFADHKPQDYGKQGPA